LRGTATAARARRPAGTFDEEELVPARSPTFYVDDYVHGSYKEDAAITQVAAITEAKARAR
jgi:hypothetical protein